MKWLIVLTNDVTRSASVENIRPVIKPTNGASKLFGKDTIPNKDNMHKTANEKKNPLLPAQSISPIIRLLAVIGAANIPSYIFSNSSRINVPKVHSNVAVNIAEVINSPVPRNWI